MEAIKREKAQRKEAGPLTNQKKWTLRVNRATHPATYSAKKQMVKAI